LEEAILKVEEERKVETLIYKVFMRYEIAFVVAYVPLDIDLSYDHLPILEVSFVAFLLNF